MPSKFSDDTPLTQDEQTRLNAARASKSTSTTPYTPAKSTKAPEKGFFGADDYQATKLTPEAQARLDAMGVKLPKPSDYYKAPGQGESAVRGAVSGASMGIGNKAQAAIRALPELFSGHYNETRQRLEQEEGDRNRMALEENPMSYLAGAVTGSLPSGMAVARGAQLAGQGLTGGAKLAAQAAGAGGASAVQGAVRGAGETRPGASAGEYLGNAAKGAAIEGAVGGLAVPAVSAIAGKLKDAAGRAVVSRLTDGTTAPTAGSVLAQNLPLPSLGALGNVGLLHAGNDRPDWSTDAPGALAESLAAAGKGALTGALVQLGGKGLSKVANGVGDLAMAGARKVNDSVVRPAANAIEEAVNSPASGRFAAAQEVADTPFKKLNDFLQSRQGVAPGVSTDANGITTTVIDAADDQSIRRAAMEASSSPEGRAATNSVAVDNVTNPVKKQPQTWEEMINANLGDDAAAAAPVTKVIDDVAPVVETDYETIRSALKGLGYKKAEIEGMVSQIKPGTSVNDAIQQVLKSKDKSVLVAPKPVSEFLPSDNAQLLADLRAMQPEMQQAAISGNQSFAEKLKNLVPLDDLKAMQPEMQQKVIWDSMSPKAKAAYMRQMNIAPKAPEPPDADIEAMLNDFRSIRRK